MRTNKELIESGEMVPPTAYANYLINPILQESYKTYNEYATACYIASRSSWNTGSIGSYNFENNVVKGRQSILSEPAIAVSGIAYDLPEHSPNKQKEYYIDQNEAWLPDTSVGMSANCDLQIAMNQQYQGVKVKKLKLKIRKDLKNARTTNTSCPNCLSTLIINNVGVWECSKDKLYLWEREFLIYNKLNEEQKIKYLLIYSDPSMFLELHEKWNYIDPTGKRINFTCGYTNRLFNPISSYKTYLPDPIVVKIIERSLGRALTEEELEGSKEIWKGEGAYFSDFRKGRIKVKIPIIAFPSDIT